MRWGEQIIRVGKELKLNSIKWWFLNRKYHHFLSEKYGVFSGKLVSFNDLEHTDILYSKEITLSYAPPVFWTHAPSTLINDMKYVQYAAYFKNATVLGDSNLIVLPSGRVLYDLPFYDIEKRHLYIDFKILNFKDKKISYWKGNKQTIDKVIWMGGNYSWNYYHFIYEFAIKFRKLRTLNIPVDIPVLIDQVCLDVPQYKEILYIFNKENRPLVGVARDGFFEVNELFYINCPNFIPTDLKKGKIGNASGIQFDVEALRDLRNFLLPYSSSRTFPKRIFLSRKNASGKRSFNEDAVMQMLSEFEFEVVFPESLSVVDQISLFNQAEWIIGGSGAAFANLLFCNHSCKVIIIARAHYPFSGFSTIASALEIDLLYLTEEDNNKNMIQGSIHDSFYIDTSYLKTQLLEIGLK